MKPETKQVAKTVGAVVAGAAIGYVAGTLTAPAKGSETRKRIGRKAKDTVDDAKAKLADAIHR
ncbi:MAG TPA: YtxH domain-containing protein [Vicinamibacteria bacterium]|nr:YtxH domain-containing protein [Vicinamibacteria bacterium]